MPSQPRQVESDAASAPAPAAEPTPAPVAPPIPPAPTLAPAPARPPLASPSGRAKPLVFVADDDELLQQLVSHKLMQSGCETQCVDTGEALLAAVATTVPDLIVLDAMMPIMDGFEALRRLRAAPASAGIPVIMLTARRGEQDVVNALSLGANDYLAKPFMPEELALRVRSLLDKAARA